MRQAAAKKIQTAKIPSNAKSSHAAEFSVHYFFKQRKIERHTKQSRKGTTNIREIDVLYTKLSSSSVTWKNKD